MLQVFQDYKLQFPESQFREENLKEKVRQTLKELETGTSNAKNSKKAALQSDETLKRLKLTDGHASRNMLRLRQDMAHGNEDINLATSSTQEVVPAKESEASMQSGSNIPYSTGHRSKAKMLDEQVTAIKSIATTLAASASARKRLMEQMMLQGQTEQLKELHEVGIITKEEMKGKIRSLMGLDNE
jgi:hypothetical protein